MFQWLMIGAGILQLLFVCVASLSRYRQHTSVQGQNALLWVLLYVKVLPDEARDERALLEPVLFAVGI